MGNKMFSRNGYLVDEKKLGISKKELENFYSELQDKYDYLFEKLDAEFILFDGELLPWSAMGKGLIEKDFRTPQIALQTEIECLKENGFEELFDELTSTLYPLDENAPNHLKSEYKAIESYKESFQSLAQLEGDVLKYKAQVDIFGSDTADLHYKPFSILKVVKDDGEEENWISESKYNIDIFELIASDEPHLCINLSTDEFGEHHSMMIADDIEYGFMTLDSALNAFWDYVTSKKQMEGIVMKPNQVFIPGVAPYLKCRNKEYLRIVYGADYDSLPAKTDDLLAKKSIKRKLSTSIKEWELGKKMLDIKQSDISLKNENWITIAQSLFKEVEGEKALDPRL